MLNFVFIEAARIKIRKTPKSYYLKLTNEQSEDSKKAFAILRKNKKISSSVSQIAALTIPLKSCKNHDLIFLREIGIASKTSKWNKRTQFQVEFVWNEMEVHTSTLDAFIFVFKWKQTMTRYFLKMSGTSKRK